MTPGLQVQAGKPKQNKTKQNSTKIFGKWEFEKHLPEKTYLHERE